MKPSPEDIVRLRGGHADAGRAPASIDLLDVRSSFPAVGKRFDPAPFILPGGD